MEYSLGQRIVDKMFAVYVLTCNYCLKLYANLRYFLKPCLEERGLKHVSNRA